MSAGNGFSGKSQKLENILWSNASQLQKYVIFVHKLCKEPRTFLLFEVNSLQKVFLDQSTIVDNQ